MQWDRIKSTGQVSLQSSAFGYSHICLHSTGAGKRWQLLSDRNWYMADWYTQSLETTSLDHNSQNPTVQSKEVTFSSCEYNMPLNIVGTVISINFGHYQLLKKTYSVCFLIEIGQERTYSRTICKGRKA